MVTSELVHTLPIATLEEEVGEGSPVGQRGILFVVQVHEPDARPQSSQQMCTRVRTLLYKARTLASVRGSVMCMIID